MTSSETDGRPDTGFDGAQAVRKRLAVRCPVDTAFRVWTEQVNLWWPKQHSRSGDPQTFVIIEPRLGGRIYERTSMGVEYEWGEVTAWEPPHRFAYDWYLGSGADQPTHVEVSFVAQDVTSTQVDVVHRVPELIGVLWTRNVARYQSAWDQVLPTYADFITRAK